MADKPTPRIVRHYRNPGYRNGSQEENTFDLMQRELAASSNPQAGHPIVNREMTGSSPSGVGSLLLSSSSSAGRTLALGARGREFEFRLFDHGLTRPQIEF